MKNNLFKKLGRNAEPDDLDEGYNDDYYGTAYRNDYSTQPARRADRDEDEVTPVARPAAPAAVQRPAARPAAPKQPARKPAPKKTVVKYFTPADSNAGRRIVAHLADGAIVVVNISKLDRASFVRLFDYIMGAVQALDGEMNKIDKTSVVFAPHGTDISDFAPGDDEEEAAEDAEEGDAEYGEDAYEESDDGEDADLSDDEADETDEDDDGDYEEDYEEDDEA